MPDEAMTLEAIREELETSTGLPADAMRQAVAHAESLGPAIFEVANKAADGVYLLPRQSSLLFYGIHVLAAAQHKALYRPLLRFLMRPDDSVAGILGDATTKSLPSVVFSIFDGDAGALMDVIADSSADETVRWVLFDVLAELTARGLVPRESTCSFVARFERERLAEDGDSAWLGWQKAVLMLGIKEQAANLRAALKEGRIPEDVFEPDETEDDIRRIESNGIASDRDWRTNARPIDDPAAPLHWLRDPGLNLDPELKAALAAAGRQVPLSEIEQGWLGGFLSCRHVPDSTMPCAEFEGFLTALAIGPVAVPPSEYLPVIWGVAAGSGEGPSYDSPEQEAYATDLILRYASSIDTYFRAGRWTSPANCELEALEDWCYGFACGIGTKAENWKPLLTDRKRSELVAPILILSQAAEDPAERLAGDELVDAIESLTQSVHGIRAYWQRRRDGAASGGKAAPAAKVGRNEPCPCGSGRKFKRCCGAKAG